MVRIRLKRMGRTHRPFYRVAVMDVRKARDGESIEDIGTYDPMVRDKSQRFAIKMERFDYWVGVGAQPSENVATLVKKLKTNRWTAAGVIPVAQAPKQPAPPVEEAAPAPAEAEVAAE